MVGLDRWGDEGRGFEKISACRRAVVARAIVRCIITRYHSEADAEGRC